jgi:hypothetical protein
MKKYRPSHITKNNWEKFQEFVALDSFRRRLLYESQNKNKKTHGSMRKITSESLPFMKH